LMCRAVIGRGDCIGRHLSWLYGINTLGAAIGALLSAYVLIGMFGLDGTTRLAALLNIALAVAVFVIVLGTAALTPARLARGSAPPVDGVDLEATAPRILNYRVVLVLSFLSGFIAIGYEIVWYRILGILLHGTVYVFGTILFFCLAGMAVGAVLARNRIDEGRCAERFALCQLGIAAYTFMLFALVGHVSWVPLLRHLIAASFFTTFHPAPELIAGDVNIFSVYSLLDIGLWSALILALPTLLMGFGFTNLMREGTQNVERLGHSVGGVYFANILGSTIGSLTVGFIVIHYFGSENALKMLIVAGSAVPVLLYVARRRQAAAAPVPVSLVGMTRRWMYASCALAVLAVAMFPARGRIIQAIHLADHADVEFIGAEDRSGVSVLRRQNRVIAFSQESAVLGQQRLYIDGSHHGDGVDAVSKDYGVEVALGAHFAPRRVLSIGLGDGQMAATAERCPDVNELVIVELNGTLDRVLKHTIQGRAVLESEKVRYVVDDGRRWLLANPHEAFDIIIMFPLHAAHAYSGSLYSREFLEILAAHLNPDGILFLRTVDPYSTAKTIATVFPHVLRLDGSAYMAATTQFQLREERLPSSAAETVGHLMADRDVILAHTRDARINRDLGPNSEYYFTYPFVPYLQTRGRAPAVYATADRERFWKLVLPARYHAH
jgi:spermidine synthase